MNEHKNKIKIAAIIGSVRPENMTAKVLAFVVDELKKYKNVQIDIIDPHDFHLNSLEVKKKKSVEKLQKTVSKATGVILTTPEYHGSYSSTIKLVIDNLGYPSVLSGKPVALLGIASGQIGAIKALEHLRSVCSHIGSLVLPGAVSVAGVHKVFDDQGNCLDAKVEKMVRALATNLMEYIQKHICPLKAFEETVRNE